MRWYRTVIFPKWLRKINSYPTMTQSAQINIVVALDVEAQPLIHYYRLKRDHNINPFAVYKGDDKRLIVSGVGKRNAIVATGYLAGLSNANSQAWLNVGMAGGDVANFGDTVLANVIFDQETKRRYFPSLCFEVDLPQAEIVTINEPTVDYAEGVLYDMEAAGFFDAASHFSTSELIHCCKIISDNSEHEVGNITKESTLALIEDNLANIENVTKTLLSLLDQIKPDDRIGQAVAQLVKKYHFTTAQQNNLKVLVQSWVALNNAADFSVIHNLEAKNSKQYLKSLGDLIHSQSIVY